MATAISSLVGARVQYLSQNVNPGYAPKGSLSSDNPTHCTVPRMRQPVNAVTDTSAKTGMIVVGVDGAVVVDTNVAPGLETRVLTATYSPAPFSQYLFESALDQPTDLRMRSNILGISVVATGSALGGHQSHRSQPQDKER